MASKEHSYKVSSVWSGNLGQGTNSYRGYSRDHEILADGKLPILGSSDPAFRGDPKRYNPEELLVGALSACHMLWYLHLCSEANIIVIAYRDDAYGTMEETSDGSGRFLRVVLRPAVQLAPGSDMREAMELHEKAHKKCFIANSVNFPVLCEPSVTFGDMEKKA